MKKVLCFRWELVIGLISTFLFLIILSLLNEEVIKLDSKNCDLKTELTETKKRLFNALVKLDRIKLITKDEKILKILEEL